MTQLRVRARAVDMLGRQQIAGIPTAIHELFKNAHDAYAERVEVDFYRRTRVLVLRDDGYGMTREDLESRWLTLGTESRVDANCVKTDKEEEEEWRGPKKPEKRVIMGEKGIGRLAIAVIAPITLLMTRASRPNGLGDLVVTLVHWGLFEQPGIDISAIDIPIKEFSGGVLPSKKDVGDLIDKVANNIRSLRKDIGPEAYQKLLSDLEQARVIGPDKLDATLNLNREHPLTLSGDGYGTHFIVLPVAPELDDDIDGGADKESSKLERNLLGFSNTMTGDLPIIKTEFRDHQMAEVESLIGPSNFFTSDEFEKVDQYFEGEFDPDGQFKGVVSVYGKKHNFVCNWVEGRGRSPRCGPFSIRYGYVQGDKKETSLEMTEWQRMTAKLDRLGGLYVYRNGVRVLPYGHSDYDYLDIEKRRTKSAQDWFFSYRRGFGYISISHEDNATLTEKAGREGFRENQAYRDFRSILVNLFQQLALEFFRPTGSQGELFWDNKVRLAAQYKLLEKQSKKADGRRKDFRTELASFFKCYETNYFEYEADRILNELQSHVESLSSEESLGELAAKLRFFEVDVRKKYRTLFNKSVVSCPRGLALGKALEKDWSAYERMFLEIKETVLDPLLINIDDLLKRATEGRLANAQRREIAIQDIERERDSALKSLMMLRREAYNASDVMQKSFKNVLQEQFSELRMGVESLVVDFVKKTAEKPERLDVYRRDVEGKIIELRQQEIELFDSFRRQMVELSDGINERETLDDRFAALENRNQLLEEQLDFYSDFAQMGMSVGILQHEFERAAKGIRVAMADLKPWAISNPPLAVIYGNLRDHIEHLDGYLKVLDPLGRRMHRSTVKLSGDEILTVLRRVFSEYLLDAKIEVLPTPKFRDKTVECKSSALLGAFINIIDNAIYWVSTGAESRREIILDADERGFLISNTGPGIEERMRDRIFEFGETKKPGGRGMGLAISRETLRREGFEVELITAGLDLRPVFRIRPMDEQGEQNAS
ncbi:UNVERIFIED_ORG: signal transduction histidine kinase [Pseudomonas reinekei]|uniref:ATP-binding protein n=1 Tax=Pseudomonas laurylsulfatiphila TaxID=2011015 RepID=UPI003D1B8BCD|nr:signal transduction histidine kinase [Pseudomonas reinekei]